MDIETDLFVELLRDGEWEVSRLSLDYDENFTVNKEELLKLAHLLIQTYRREQQKEETGPL